MLPGARLGNPNVDVITVDHAVSIHKISNQEVPECDRFDTLGTAKMFDFHSTWRGYEALGRGCFTLFVLRD